MPRALVYLVPVAMTVYGIVDLMRSEPKERAGLKAWVWALIILVPVLGTVTWLVVSRSQRTAHTPTGHQPRQDADRRAPAGSRSPSWDRRRGPLAPDDDPEFLWRLEQQQRRAARKIRPEDGGGRRSTDPTPESGPPADPAVGPTPPAPEPGE